MNEVLEIQRFFQRLYDLRKAPTFGALTELEDLIDKAARMFDLCCDVTTYINELREEIDMLHSDFPDQQMILNAEVADSIERRVSA